ncbi:UNKNOWN [Stylonychia lemnae]|uniref:Transmembrane protein n=1 Tax=Stylonychia lemnae TaxID=5949 RepID=A0A078AXT9_STYLE|nr:UNKNOWN [Stylonychia lemnae]|eukprot:CDW85613.1 UNKNOWN [Stylonychia lemnae]
MSNKKEKETEVANPTNTPETAQGFQFIPTRFKKSETKEGSDFRWWVTFFLFLHVGFICLALTFIKFFLVLFQLLYIYFCYFTCMTLSRLVGVAYLLSIIGGGIYGIYDLFDFKSNYGFESMILYIGILVVQAFGFFFIGRSMINYTKSLNQPAHQPLIEKQKKKRRRSSKKKVDQKGSTKGDESKSEYTYYSQSDEEKGKKEKNDQNDQAQETPQPTPK